jgi:hypothetical protein
VANQFIRILVLFEGVSLHLLLLLFVMCIRISLLNIMVISICLSTSHMHINCLQPNLQSKTQKEGAESDQFWALLGEKSEYPSQKIVRVSESDSHLFSCNFSKGMDN